MPTRFALTFDSVYGSLTLVSEEQVFEDIEAVHITKSPRGGYEVEVVRAGKGTPVKLVASASPAGRQALERANGRMSSVPGFVELAAPSSTTVSSLSEDIAKMLGWERPTTGT